MERRFIVFLVVSFAILFGYSSLVRHFNPPQEAKKAAVEAVAGAKKTGQIEGDRDKTTTGDASKEHAKKREKANAGEASGAAKTRDGEEKPGDGQDKAGSEIRATPEPKHPERWVTLGSADPDPKRNPYRMLVTLTSRGAALARIELSSSRYCDVDDRSGYLGHILAASVPGTDDGCVVQSVGAGTPAAKAGLRPGDILKVAGGKPVTSPAALERILKKTRPNQNVQLVIVRGGREMTLEAKLRRRPLEVIKPEEASPLSMLLSLQQVNASKLPDLESDVRLIAADDAASPRDAAERCHTEFVDGELKNAALRAVPWRLDERESNAEQAVFVYRIPGKGLEFRKTYRLAKTPEASLADVDFPAYHLEFEVEIRNVGGKACRVAYRLDGPNGLPLEGKWYASKVSRNWGGSGLRDFVISFNGDVPGMVNATKLADGKDVQHWTRQTPTFIGVDAQYFSAVLMPRIEKGSDAWFEEVMPLRVGRVDPEHTTCINTSCRMISATKSLSPGEAMHHQFRLFAGPKRPKLLENDAYRLGELVYYGWPIFAAVAVPLTKILHVFYALTCNYGLAIILLTVLVRGCMFPLSLKQAAGAQKMQLIQPELKKLQEKYKNNVEARTKAQQEIFKKHGYHPASGCLVVFIQMPIFIGLYRALMVDIELRDAPLISHAIRWCSNLAAPDMLYDWHSFMPAFINNGVGLFGLGPYFNLLPILTIVLFLWQQHKMMPPPADEQAAMQQKMMKYMMIFMGVMFFKVASGLCIYFIASSLWGLGERRFLPKTAPVGGAPGAPGGSIGDSGNFTFGETRAQAKAREREAAQKGK